MRSRAATLLAASCRASLLCVGCWLTGGCSGAHEPTQTLPNVPRASIAPATNVPALLGRSIDDLRTKLGPTQQMPRSFIDPIVASSAGPTGQGDSLAAFRTRGLTLVASYDARTREVRDLLIVGRHEDSLMAQASLQARARHYLIMPVFYADRPNHLLGLRVIDIK